MCFPDFIQLLLKRKTEKKISIGIAKKKVIFKEFKFDGWLALAESWGWGNVPKDAFKISCHTVYYVEDIVCHKVYILKIIFLHLAGMRNWCSFKLISLASQIHCGLLGAVTRFARKLETAVALENGFMDENLLHRLEYTLTEPCKSVSSCSHWI